jgi:arylformamidase
VSNRFDDAMDQAYNVRRAIPEHPEIFARWRAEADDYRESTPDALIDLAYGPDPKQRLDLFPANRCQTDPRSPLVVLIHGGYWQALDKADNRQMARALNAAGYAVAVLNYRLCPDVGIEEIVYDVAAACGWLIQQATRLELDGSQLAILGHSAGAHLAAMLACQHSKNETTPRFPIRYLGLVSGVYDLTPLIATRINDKLGLTEDQARTLSPAYLKPPVDLVVDIWVGEHETTGFFEQHRLLCKCWGDSVELSDTVIEATNHLSIWDQLAFSNSRLATRTLANLDRVFGRLEKQ